MDNNDYRSLADAVQKWLKEKQDYDLRRNKVFGINPKLYLYVFGFLFIYTFFIKDFKLPNFNNNSSLPSASNYILYEKPDNESKVILEDNSKTDVKILNETKFYYQVEFSKDGVNYTGYINKSKIKK